MQQKDPLYELIHHLTPNEKRYFKLYLSSYKKDYSTGIKLFNFLEKMKTYDEKLIKKTFAKEKFIKHYHIAKGRLQDLILNAMIEYKKEKSDVTIITNYIDKIDYLLNKHLYTTALPILHKAIEFTRKKNIVLLLPILYWYNRRITFNFVGNSMLEKMKGYWREGEELYQELNTKISLEQLLTTARYYSLRIGFGGDESNLSKIKEFFKYHTLKDENQLNSTEDKLAFYAAQIYFYQTCKDNKMIIHFKSKYETILNINRSEFSSEKFHFHTLQLINFEYFGGNLESFIEKANQYILNYGYEKRNVLLFKIGILDSYISLGQIDNFKKSLYEIEENDSLKDIPERDKKMLYHSTMGLNFFIIGNFDKALRHSNILQTYYKQELENEIRIKSDMDLLQLLIYYERKNYNLFEKQYSITKLSFANSTPKSISDTIILTNLKKLMDQTDNRKIKSILIDFDREIKNQHTILKKESNLFLFYISKWIESKTKGCEVADLLKKGTQND